MTDSDDNHAGLVVEARGRRGTLEDGAGVRVDFVTRGRVDQVVCGDRVRWQFADTERRGVVITEVEPRSNSLERWGGGTAKKIETLAANLTHVAIVLAPLPEPDWRLIDRYLCAAELMGCRASLVTNKTDLAVIDSGEIDTYRRIGYSVIPTDARTSPSLDALRSALKDQRTILVGQSGVGKSSLLNALIPGIDVVTQSVSSATDEGRHTTSAATLRPLPGGGEVIDTPGVREFVPAFRERGAVQTGFREISAASGGCKFHNCEHTREPDCAVKAAVDGRSIDEWRYASYKRILNSL